MGTESKGLNEIYNCVKKSCVQLGSSTNHNCQVPASHLRHFIDIGLLFHPCFPTFSSPDSFSQRRSSLLICSKCLRRQKLINCHSKC